MKRKLKSLFRVAIGIITTGTVMVIVGLLLGGAGELSKEVTELVHVVRVGVSETVARIPMLEKITDFNGFTVVVDVDRDDVSVEINEEFETIQGDYCNMELAEAESVENLDISVLNGVFRMEPSANGYFGVESSGAEQYQCYVSEGTLYLNALPKDFGKSEDSEIVLYVPTEQEYEKVYLFCSGEQVSSNVVLKGEEIMLSSICGTNRMEQELLFEDVTITVGVGTMSVYALEADSLQLEVSTAEVSIKEMVADTVEVHLGMGSLSMQGSTGGNIDLNCGMGNLELLLTGLQEDYNYDISGSAESVQVGGDVLAGMVMERWIDNAADKQITLSCAMGSVKIQFEE